MSTCAAAIFLIRIHLSRQELLNCGRHWRLLPSLCQIQTKAKQWTPCKLRTRLHWIKVSTRTNMPRQCVPNSLCLLHHRSWTPSQRIMGAPGSSRQQFIPGDLRKSRSNHPNHHGTLVGSTMLILPFPAPSRSLKTTSQKFLAAPLRCHMWARFVY